jgi:pimeloyl-ACP methyl ester carboxylesterase
LYHYSSVIVFDYRGYGRSSDSISSISEESMNIDATTIWKYLVNILEYNPNDISLFGESLGAAIASRLTYELSKCFQEKTYPRALILQAPFISLHSMTNRLVISDNVTKVISFVSGIIGDEYCNDVYLNLINQCTKLMIVHSAHDDVVPYSQGRTLYEMLKRNDVNFVTIAGSHNSPRITDEYVYSLEEILNP